MPPSRTTPPPITFATVRKFCLALPDVAAGTSYGAPDFKVKGRLFACKAINKSAEPGTLWVRVSLETRDQLIADEPATYYLTDHYAPYAGVLVRLSRIHHDALRDLLHMAWTFISQQPARRASARR